MFPYRRRIANDGYRLRSLALANLSLPEKDRPLTFSTFVAATSTSSRHTPDEATSKLQQRSDYYGVLL